MEVTSEESEHFKLKASDLNRLSDENPSGESNQNNFNTTEQGQIENLKKSSLKHPGKLAKTDKNCVDQENGYNLGDTQIKTTTNMMGKNTPNVRSVVKINENPSGNKRKSNPSDLSKNSTEEKSDSLPDSHESKPEGKYQIFPKSVPSSVNVNNNLTIVTFQFENISFTSAFDIATTIEEIKNRLIYILDLEDLVILENNDIEANNSHSLADLGAQTHGKVMLKIWSKSEKGNAVLREKIKENIPTLEVITVHLGGKRCHKNIVVEIVNESVQKQWLGGYRNKLTNTEYHNASTQTMKKKKIFEFDEATGEMIPLFFNRDSQTPFRLTEKKVNTVVNKATQMSRSDLYLTSTTDKIITAQIYTTYESEVAQNENMIKYIIIIQRAVRRWIALKKFMSIVNFHLEELKTFKETKQRILQEQADRERITITGGVYPTRREDFYTLFLKIEKWWKKEWRKICETKTLESRKAASNQLIEKEIDLLQAIEKHKEVSKKESLKKEDMRFLEQTSRPVLFRSSNGQLTIIDYLETQKARQFKEIYSALARKDLLIKDRIEILMALKQVIESQYMTYEYAEDLVSLINRELELIRIGFKVNDLKGLQIRIEQLFLDFLHKPEFNPSAKKYIAPNFPKLLHQTFQCTRCLKLLPASKFAVHVRMTAFNTCRSCTWMQNIAQQRDDLSPFMKLLLNVRNSEKQKCCHAALCFILQPIGMAYLTSIIWNGHSAISECSDISKLKHVRWLPDVEWAPWNTILLTNQEAKLHMSIPDIFSFYGEYFVEKVRRKHILARKRFIPLLIMDHDIRSSGRWSTITDSGLFLHPSHPERIAIENNEFDAI